MGLILPTATQPVLVRGPSGDPEPPSEIVKAIKRVCGPEFGLKFSKGLAGAGWDVSRAWGENDPRRAWIQRGDYDPEAAWDRIGSLPFDCSLNDAPAFLERMLKDYPKEDVQKLRERMHHWNAVTVPTQQVEAAVAATMEMVQSDQNAPKGLQVFSGKRGRSKRS